MRSSRYLPVLLLQNALLFIDILLNAFGDFGRSEFVILLVLSVVQDIGIICNVIILFLMFANTYVFRAGLLGILISRYRFTLITCFVYLAITIAWHFWNLKLIWDNPYAYNWTTYLLVLFILQKSCAVFYYYFYKRTSLLIVDPCFYDDSEWLKLKISKEQRA
ncbi:transmembrane protein 138 [Parasteatoda tepidariorum]|uniref:transmembrane protein 138 n=1 Tax=Parasteatoda tepidariorum TaxID=114398 RepID=UPI00077FB52E|nr:transmembrane protein 138 [Parasteatoda tepidariorum]